MDDFFGLQVVWPPDGIQPLKHDHDIVFVHGLRKGSISDWKDEYGDFWPAARLGLDLGTARIFAYGYDQEKLSMWSDGLYEGGIIFKHGAMLCSDLEQARSADKVKSPLTLIGHGTGGTVIQSALCLALSPMYGHRSMLQKVRHVVFLDTPQKSLTQSSWELVAEGSPSKDSATRQILWSTLVAIVRDSFGKLADRWNITSAHRKLGHVSSGSPYEKHSSYQLGMPHEKILVLDIHEKRSITELVASNDLYEQLLCRLQAGRICITNAEHHIQKLRNWLGTPSEALNIGLHQSNLQRYHPNTGRWLFEDPTFQDWARPEGAVSFIWLTGSEGCGKSILVSQVIERIVNTNLQSAAPRLMLSLDKPRSEYELTASLATQLLSYVLDNAGGIVVESLFIIEQSDDKLSQIQALIRLLISQCPVVFFFVDGIDDIPAYEEEGTGDWTEETTSTSYNRTKSEKQDADGKKNVGRAQRHVYSTLAFLAGLASNSASAGSPVKLWCSSARTAFVQEWLEEFDTVSELNIQPHLVAKDVKDYLEHQMDKTKASSSVPEKSNLVDCIGANFLLARWVLEYNKISESSMRALESSGPVAAASQSLNAFIEARLAEMQSQQSHDGKNVARKILSLLAFAKRPLKLSELQEALAILSSPFEDIQGRGFGTRDITIKKVHQGFQNVQDLIECCSPFLEFAQSGDTASQDGWIRFSHASILRLLTTSHDTIKLGIDPIFMATACLKYLAQWRYSSEQLGRESLQHNKHRFLPYAAKYWHRHLNSAGGSLLRETKSFIQSRQFFSAIQIQSLFVDQHFYKSQELQQYGSLLRRSVKLPLSLDADAQGLRLVKEYQSFVQDWTDFLQLGTTTALMRGQIQRCFWGALPKDNFLRRLGASTESQQSYLLEVEAADPECQHLYQAHSSDGRRLSLWRLDSANTDADIITLVRTCWYIDGERPPFRYGSDEMLTTSREKVLWKTYHNGRPQKKLLVPALGNSDLSPSDLSPVIQEVVFGLEVRVGNQRFTRQKGGIWSAVAMTDGCETYWEDIISGGDYVVRSRRKVAAPQRERPGASLGKSLVREVEDDSSVSSFNDDDENEQPSRPAQADFHNEKTSKISPRKRSKRRASWSSEADMELSSSENEPDEHLAYENFEDIVSSAEEYCAQSVPDDEISDDGYSFESNSDSYTGRDTEAEDVENSTDDDSDNAHTTSGSSTDHEVAHAAPKYVDSTRATPISMEDAASSEDDNLPAADDVTTSNAASDNTLKIGSHADDEASSLDSEIAIESRPDFSRQPVSFTKCQDRQCDICGLNLIKKRRRSQATVDFYRCFLCTNNVSWDVCEKCFGKGNWCRNRSHLLHMGTYSFHAREEVLWRLIPSKNAPPMTELVVERRFSGKESTHKLVSRFTRRLSSMLRDSGPVMHPTFPLLLFPLDGRELLFMNMQDSTYFTYDIPYDPAETAETGAGTCLPISVRLHLSSCGRYLQVLRFTARSESKSTPTRLFAILFTVSLNLENPCSGRPKTLAPCRGADLGHRKTLVYQIPFEVVWTDTYAYIAVVGGAPIPILRVVRFPIVTGTRDDNSQGNVYTLSEDIALPSSALFRPVYFFPAIDKGVSRIILGCLGGALTQPPIVVYLDRGNTGQWVPTRSLPVFSQTTHEQRSSASIEGSDLYDECNAITSHDSDRQAVRGQSRVINIELFYQEAMRTTAQDHSIYCPSCFQLCITLQYLGKNHGVRLQGLDLEMDNLLPGTGAEDAQIKYSWEITIPTLIQALENGCQFCSLVAVHSFGDIHENLRSLFLGPDGTRCCAIGPSSKKKSQEVLDAIKTLRGLRFDPDLPEEERKIVFTWDFIHGDGLIRSFSKMVIDVAVNVNHQIEKHEESSEKLVRFSAEDGGLDGCPNITVRFLGEPGVYRRRDSLVLELYSLRETGAHEWIPTRPITTDRGGDENLSAIKGWLEECRTKHPFCWRRDNTHKPIDEAQLPTRLLEITNDKFVRLVETEPSQLGRYIILSYCWGPDPNANMQTTRANLHTRLVLGIPQKDLPAAIRDAVTMTSKLNLKHIWVDALCMVQDSPDEMNRELSRMSAYYRNAYLTLTASTLGCNMGFLGTVGRCKKHPNFPLPRDLVPLRTFSLNELEPDRGKLLPVDSQTVKMETVYVRKENPYQLAGEPISHRAWTLQEQLLSPRMLFFGGRVIWFCRAAMRCDGGVEDWSFDENASDRLARDFQMELIKGKRMKSWNMPSEPRSSSTHLETCRNRRTDPDLDLHSLWYRIVVDYSHRQLSHPEDKLPALSAVAAEFAHLCGSEYLAGLWRSNLARDLLWSTPEAAPRLTKAWCAPSWSWASVDEDILFNSTPPSDAVQLAVIEKAEVEPLTPEVPFGRLRDASGVLDITAPAIVSKGKGDEDLRGRVSDFFSEDYNMKHNTGKSLLLLYQKMVRDGIRNPYEKKDTKEDGSPERLGLLQKFQQREKYKIPQNSLMLILFGRRDSGIQTGAEGNETWRFWGLLLEPVEGGGESETFRRNLAFFDMRWPLHGQDISTFQKHFQRTVRII